MGFSRGGGATLFASLRRFHKLWNTSGAHFAAFVPFYPDCMTSYQSDDEVAARPMRIFHGSAGRLQSGHAVPRVCERLRPSGRTWCSTEYAQAHHGFNNPLGARLRSSRNSQDRPPLHHPRGRDGRAGQRRDPAALHLHRRLRRARSARRPRSGGDAGGASGSRRIPEDAVQALGEKVRVHRDRAPISMPSYRRSDL